MPRVVVDESLFAALSPPRLAGSRCPDCATLVFPRHQACPRCSRTNLIDEVVPGWGTVWSWTVQEFAPKPPFRSLDADFVPYAVGYVDLGDVLVESRLEIARDRLRIGLLVRLITVAAYRSDSGDDVHTFAFVAAE